MKSRNDTPAENEQSRKNIWSMFDQIAHRYDFLNHSLSLGQDIIWRSQVSKCISGKGFSTFLDIATGTGDQLIRIVNKVNTIQHAIGLDMSINMLNIGMKKIANQNIQNRTALIHGDALNLPIDSDSVELVTISFGIRNVIDVSEALKEMFRVMKTGGMVIILEFSIPKNRLFRIFYLFYLRNILPVIGSLISGNKKAYTYLNKTIETFPCGNEFCDIMKKSGFTNISAKPLTFGIATLYRAGK